MSDLLKKRTIQERLVIDKTLLETVSDDLPSELSNNSPKLDNENGDLISRKELLKLPQRKGYAVNGWETYIRVSDIKELPSVQPPWNPDEWCHDCKEYDKEKHCCPRWNRVIRNALEEAKPRKGKWIRTRTMTHDGELYCDQCEQEHPEQKIIWNFCPNCGCRMEEGDSE